MEGEAENTQDRMARTRGKGSFKHITIFVYDHGNRRHSEICVLQLENLYQD